MTLSEPGRWRHWLMLQMIKMSHVYLPNNRQSCKLWLFSFSSNESSFFFTLTPETFNQASSRSNCGLFYRWKNVHKHAWFGSVWFKQPLYFEYWFNLVHLASVQVHWDELKGLDRHKNTEAKQNVQDFTMQISIRKYSGKSGWRDKHSFNYELPLSANTSLFTAKLSITDDVLECDDQ